MLDEPDTAPISESLRATLRFLRKMTASPESIGPEDARAVLACGVSKAALLDAIHVAYLFNIYDRLADTLDWQVPPEGDAAYDVSASHLLSKKGYLL